MHGMGGRKTGRGREDGIKGKIRQKTDIIYHLT